MIHVLCAGEFLDTQMFQCFVDDRYGDASDSRSLEVRTCFCAMWWLFVLTTPWLRCCSLMSLSMATWASRLRSFRTAAKVRADTHLCTHYTHVSSPALSRSREQEQSCGAVAQPGGSAVACACVTKSRLTCSGRAQESLPKGVKYRYKAFPKLDPVRHLNMHAAVCTLLLGGTGEVAGSDAYALRCV